MAKITLKRLAKVVVIVLVLICAKVAFFVYIKDRDKTFYEMLQDIKDKKMDMEVCYMPLNYDKESIDSLYEYCKNDNIQDTNGNPLTFYHHQVPFESYEHILQNIYAQSLETAKIRSDIIAPLYNNDVFVFFTKDNQALYSVFLGQCPRINGQNYEYNQNLYTLLESMIATQDSIRAKRILSSRSNVALLRPSDKSCMEAYISRVQEAHNLDNLLQKAQERFYHCIDFTDNKERCQMALQRDEDYANKKALLNPLNPPPSH